MTPSGVTSARVRNYVRAPRRQSVKKKPVIHVEMWSYKHGRGLILTLSGTVSAVKDAKKIIDKHLFKKGAKK